MINASKIFNKVIYVALDGIKKVNLQEVHFYAAYRSLDDAYSAITTNKKFLAKMEEIGYPFHRKLGKYYIFRKEQKNESNI